MKTISKVKMTILIVGRWRKKKKLKIDKGCREKRERKKQELDR